MTDTMPPADLTLVRDELAIRGLIERYSDACCQRNVDAIMALWADDCRWSVPDMEGLEDVRGKDAIHAIWQGAQALFPFCFLVCTPGVIEIEGDTAWARTYTNEVLVNTEGETRQAVGIYHDKFAVRGGRWLFTERTWHMLKHL
ncbi:nuclear transport factor 2 family protein [Novosphingobium sp. KCTC 2891]|uniref:nuclear transport factor 2 family protein n=1 Tax=Novosphingobium sp. KCTC 2891 TaxID=2989730 RepID=UPI0022239B8E|nr:nuclear transport factor 2 family protein [Novosphingobium sp. KCTC 2891]MCW1384681.1 nuclear transport factor 2 family protein [Novosphingobium sp. KCTC 2891]